MRRAALLLLPALSAAASSCAGSEAARAPAAKPSVAVPATKVLPVLAYTPPPPLSLAATREGPIAVQGLSGQVVVIADVAFATEGEGGSLRLDPKLLAGLPMGPSEATLPWVDDLGGRLPDGAFLTLDMMDPGGASYIDPRVFRLDANGWTVATTHVPKTADAPPSDDSYGYADFAPWVGDRVLALAVYSPPGPGVAATEDDVHAARPRLDVIHGDASMRPPALDPALCPDRLLALPTGEIFVFGQRCSSGAVHVQRFREGKSVIEAVASPGCRGGTHYVRALDARAFDDVWLAVEETCDDNGSSYLSHFDGRAWSVVKTPAEGVVTALSATPEGVLWVALDDGGADQGGLYRRWPDGRWDEAPLPHVDASHPSEVLSAKDVWAKSAGEVWVVAARYVDGRYRGSLVLRSGAAKDVLALPSADEIRWAQADAATPEPATAACPRPLLLIAKLPQAAPAAFDYAELRAAVRGREDLASITYREVMWHGERWAAASAPARLDLLDNLRLVLEDKLFGARPVAYCGFYPRVVRSFTIDEDGELELPD